MASEHGAPSHAFLLLPGLLLVRCLLLLPLLWLLALLLQTACRSRYAQAVR